MKNKKYIMKFGGSKSVYIVKSCQTLYHWEKEDHKYVAKIEMPNYTRYFYTDEEYKKYLENQNKKSDSIFDKIGSLFENIIAKPISEVTNALTNSINKGLKYVKARASKSLLDLDRSTRPYRNAIKNTFKKILFGPNSIKTSSARDYTKYVEKVKLPNGKTRYFYDIKSYVRYLNRQRYQKQEPDFMKNVPETDYYNHKDDPETELQNINDNRYYESKKNGDKKYSINCQLCTLAYELNQRGYAVRAGYMDANDPDRSKMRRSDAMKYVFKNPVTIKYKDVGAKKIDVFTTTSLSDFIKQNSPPNSRGNLQVDWVAGGGHSMAYEVDAERNVTIIDGQIGERYSEKDTPNSMNILAHNIIAESTQLVRTDNLELKEEILKYVEY